MEEVYAQLAAKLGHPDSEYLPQILEYAVPPRQASILTALNQPPEPALTVPQLAEKLGLDAEAIQQDLEDLFHKGFAFPRNFHDRREWRLVRAPWQLHDSMLSGWMFYPEPEKLQELWHLYDKKERYRTFRETYAAMSTPLMRVLPAWEAVADNPNLQGWEDWREILKGMQVIAVADCPCRLKVKACNRPVGVCVDFNRNAEYDIARGHGRKLSYEEALQIMGYAARSGLVHTVPNTAVVGFMCNCCACCCVEFQTLQHCNIPVSHHYAKSRYQATIDQDICNGCQKCIDNCNFDAITMLKPPGFKKLKAQVNPEACYGCGCCFMVCEPKAISLECVRPVSHVPGVEES